MEYNLITNIESCYYNISPLIYYSHIPTGIIALILCSFVYLKNKDILGKLLLAISLVFSLWLVADLIVWTSPNSYLVMTAWSFFGILYALLYILSFYFVYVYIKKTDLPFWIKFSFAILFLPVIIFSSTHYNLDYFNVPECEAIEGTVYTSYYYYLGFFIFLGTLIFGFFEYFKAGREFGKQILLLLSGIGFFLLSFFVAGFIASYLDNFNLEQIGLIGMPIFMGFLAYLIVKFKAFDIKLIGAQALIFILVLLIGSQFTFAQNTTSMVLTGITLALSVVSGYFLIRSVKSEVQRKEELQLMADALAVSNDKLRKLDNAKTEFISIASHQLRTPLTAIKGFVALLLEGSYGDINKEMKSALTNVHIAAERLINLVEDLLNVSRIESGRMEYKKEEQSISNLLKELESIFDIVAKNKGLSFEVKKVEADLPNVLIDDSKMREVISNLIDNALKYTERGGVTVRAEYGPTSNYKPQELIGPAKLGQKVEHENSGANGFVRVVVSDTGIGIPATELPYLFSKFSRGKDTSRLHVGGTGLGLFVGKNIVEAHGGHIWAESDGDGLGSRFIVELPAVGS